MPRFLSLLLCAVLSFASKSQALEKWSLNDVSILLPIQEKEALTALPGPASHGVFGEILPRAFYDQVGRINSFEDPAITFAKFRVVGIRIDPCFRGGVKFEICISQVRLTWQPIEILPDGSHSTSDATLHTFYELSHQEFDSLVLALAKVRAQYGRNLSGLTLQVHPVIAAQGLRGPFFTLSWKMILDQIGAKRMTRFTFMKLSGGGSLWDFGGFAVEAGVLKPLTIARVGKPRQVFQNGANSQDTDFFSSRTLPEAPSDQRNVNWLASDSAMVRKIVNEPLILANVTDARFLENPKLAMTDATDCVSCHVAQPARRWAFREMKGLNLEKRSAQFLYRSRTHRIENMSKVSDFSTNLRAFGYFGAEPALNQRLIHESAEVADSLNNPALFFKK